MGGGGGGLPDTSAIAWIIKLGRTAPYCAEIVPKIIINQPLEDIRSLLLCKNDR